MEYSFEESRRCPDGVGYTGWECGSIVIINTEWNIHNGSRGAVRTIHAGGHGIVNGDVKRVKMLYVRSEICMKGVSDL